MPDRHIEDQAVKAAPIPPGPPPTTTKSAVRQTRVSLAASRTVLPRIFADAWPDSAVVGNRNPPAPTAKAADPFMAVFLMKFLGLIP